MIPIDLPSQPRYQKLEKLIRERVGGPELLRILVRIGHGSFGKVVDDFMLEHSQLKLRVRDVKCQLETFERWGVVVCLNHEGEETYFPTTLAHKFVWDEESVDWLPSACLAASIVTESEPGRDIVKALSDELHLNERKARAVLIALESLFKGPVRDWLVSHPG